MQSCQYIKSPSSPCPSHFYLLASHSSPSGRSSQNLYHLMHPWLPSYSPELRDHYPNTHQPAQPIFVCWHLVLPQLFHGYSSHRTPYLLCPHHPLNILDNHPFVPIPSSSPSPLLRFFTAIFLSLLDIDPYLSSYPMYLLSMAPN